MSLWQDRYEIEVKVNDTVLDYPPSAYTFTMYDSIFSFYSKGSFNFNDITNMFSEFLIFPNGTKIDIKFGIKDNYISCPYTIVRNSMPQQTVQSNMGGTIEIPLVHNYFFNQTNLSKAFIGQEISNIVKQKVQQYNFSRFNIENTITKGNWYQPLVNDATFINDFLLPFAYSNDAENSPYYAFVNSDNTFNFTTYKKMFDDKPVLSLALVSSSQVQSLAQDSIYAINFSQESLSNIRPLLNRIISYFDKNGNFNLDEDSILDYPSNRIGNIALQANMTNVTDLYHLLDDDIVDKDIINKNKALQISSMKKAFHIEKVIITTNLNISIMAGKKIKLLLPIRTDEEKTELSNRFSGEYIIESAYHRWTGHIGTSVFVCSRQDIEVPGSYVNKDNLIQ